MSTALLRLHAVFAGRGPLQDRFPCPAQPQAEWTGRPSPCALQELPPSPASPAQEEVTLRSVPAWERFWTCLALRQPQGTGVLFSAPDLTGLSGPGSWASRRAWGYPGPPAPPCPGKALWRLGRQSVHPRFPPRFPPRDACRQDQSRCVPKSWRVTGRSPAALHPGEDALELQALHWPVPVARTQLILGLWVHRGPWTALPASETPSPRRAGAALGVRLALLPLAWTETQEGAGPIFLITHFPARGRGAFWFCL